MSLPTREQVLSLDFDLMGEPFARVNGPGLASSLTLDFDWRGEPFAAAFDAGAVRARYYYDMIGQSRFGG